MPEQVDVCIIGSGFGGAIPAYRLAGRGCSVVVLERGKYLTGKDYRQTQDFKYLMSITQAYMGENVGIVHGRCVGGGSITYGAVSLRAPTEAFEKTDGTGKRYWPTTISRQSLDPYYDRVAGILKVNQSPWETIPKKGGTLAKWLDSLGYTCERAPYAIVDCRECGWCTYGCIYDKKQSLILNYLPGAEALGARIRPECEARTVSDLPPSSLPYRFSVIYRDRNGAEQEIQSKIFIAACGAVETPALLLRSQTGLPSVNWSQVGKNLSLDGDNLFVALAGDNGPFPMTYQGREDGGVISFAFWREKKFMLEIVTLFPGQAAALGLARPGNMEPARWGINNKRLMRLWSSRMIFIATVGMTPGDGAVTIDSSGAAQVGLTPSPELIAYNQDAFATVKHIVEANGGEIISGGGTLSALGGGSVHPLGTCRMGEDPATSVVSGLPGDLRGDVGEAWDVPGLYITDGSILSYAPGVNPSLTIGALAEMISEKIGAKYFP